MLREITMVRQYWRLTLHVVVLFSLLAGCRPDESPPPVRFVEPRGDSYAAKVDFAQLEHDLPLRPEDLKKITPDNLNQWHKFIFAIDQSYLPTTIAGCNRLLDRFPVTGPGKVL